MRNIILYLLFSSVTAGAKVSETLHLTWENGMPNGQSRDMIFTNGQFPAPNLSFDEGDEVEVCRSPYIA
jgi:hypothetical protein